MQAHRKVSIKKLTRKLGLVPYDHRAEYIDVDFKPPKVIIPLSQHIGQPAESLVIKGDRVTIGQKIGAVPDGAVGAYVHASINGIVTQVDKNIIIKAE